MRLVAVFFVSLPFLLPSVTNAAPAPLCVGGEVNEFTLRQSFGENVKPEIVRAFLNKAVCSNPCFDVDIDFSIDTSKEALVISMKSTNKCSKSADDPKGLDAAKSSPKRGCAKGDSNPAATMRSPSVKVSALIVNIDIKSQTIGPKNRCDPKALLNSIDGITSSFKADGRIPNAEKVNAAIDLADRSLPAPSSGALSSAVNAALSSELAEKLGITEEQAKEIESKVGAVEKLTAAYLSGDADKLKAAAKESGFELSDDLLSKISRLTPEERKEDVEDGEEDSEPKPSETFTKEGREIPTQCGIEGISGLIMRAESSCGRVNSNPLSSVQGPYHYLCDTWRADTAATGMGAYSDCAYRNDPNIATRVVEARYALHEQKYGQQCASAGLTWTACVYAIHVFGEGGYKNLMSAYMSDPSASAFSVCGSALSRAACSNNASIFKNGGSVSGIFSELDRRLTGSSVIPKYAGSTDWTSDPYVSRSSLPALQTQTSPFNMGLNQSQSYNTAPVGSSSGGSSAPVVSSAGVQQTPVSQLITPAQTPVSAAVQQLQEALGLGTSGPKVNTIPVQPVASILVQPKQASVGSPIMISWSTVGMSASQPCAILVATKNGTTTIARSNEGSRSIPTSAAVLGDWFVTLQCTPITGGMVTQATSASVQ